MTITIHKDVLQGTDEWQRLRLGLLTASEIHLAMTPKTKKAADNKDIRAHIYELAAQRITKYVEPHYYGEDMMRGDEVEAMARDLYIETYGEVEQVGFVTRDLGDGVIIGCSPDGLVGDRGIVEIKGPRAKHHLATIIADAMPDDHVLQVQGELFTLERDWCDFISYHEGLPMFVKRVPRDEELIAAIEAVARDVNGRVAEMVAKYEQRRKTNADRLTDTVRRSELEIMI